MKVSHGIFIPLANPKSCNCLTKSLSTINDFFLNAGNRIAYSREYQLANHCLENSRVLSGLNLEEIGEINRDKAVLKALRIAQFVINECPETVENLKQELFRKTDGNHGHENEALFREKLFKLAFKTCIILEYSKFSLPLEEGFHPVGIDVPAKTAPHAKLFGNRIYCYANSTGKAAFYALGRPLGTGGQNICTLATNILKGKLEVYRCLKPEHFKVVSTRNSALYEQHIHAEMLGNPEIGPWIVRMHNPINTDTECGVFLEYCNGKDLYEEKENLSGAEKKAVLLSVFTAVAAMHKNRYAHGDLKLENILLHRIGGSLQVKVADFGATVNQEYLPVKGGTLEYFAPEKFLILAKDSNLDASELGPAMDNWALGIIAYELKFGSPPPFILGVKRRWVLRNKEISNQTWVEQQIFPLIKKGLETTYEHLDLQDPYDLLIAHLLQIEPSSRTSSSDALEFLKQITSNNFNKN